MKKEYQELAAYVAAPLENTNLAMNENHHLNWNDKLSESMIKINDNYHYSCYGDDCYDELASAYANYAGVQSNNVLIATGSESLIGLLFQTLVENNVMLIEPDFFRFEEITNLQRLTVFKTALWDGLDVDETIRLINDNDVELFIFSNPNNPLGVTIATDKIEKILENTDCYVVSDEAYMEFSGQSAVEWIEKYPKLIVLRTMSKAWGLAGLRIGFALAQPQLITYLKKSLGPFNISALTTRIAAEVIEHENYMRQTLQEIIDLREIWKDKLVEKYHFEIYPSNANFINASRDDAFIIWQFLQDNNLNVSKFLPMNLRISIGSPEEMAHLEELLDAYFKNKIRRKSK